MTANNQQNLTDQVFTYDCNGHKISREVLDVRVDRYRKTWLLVETADNSGPKVAQWVDKNIFCAWLNQSQVIAA